MPFTEKQIDLFKAAAADKEFAEKVGINQTTAKKLLKESKVKKYEEGGKVTTPKKEKERIKDMAKEERMKKILTEDMEMFGLKEESKPTKKKAGGMLKAPDNSGLKKLPEDVRNKMGYMKKGGKVGMGMTKNNYKKGGKVSSCSKRADGCVVRGKTKGRMV